MRTVLEAVEWVLPALIRVFTASDKLCVVEPPRPGMEDQARQATDYLNFIVMSDNPCFMILRDWFQGRAPRTPGLGQVLLGYAKDHRDSVLYRSDQGAIRGIARRGRGHRGHQAARPTSRTPTSSIWIGRRCRGRRAPPPPPLPACLRPPGLPPDPVAIPDRLPPPPRLPGMAGPPARSPVLAPSRAAAVAQGFRAASRYSRRYLLCRHCRLRRSSFTIARSG